MTTCRDVIKSAYRRSGIMAAGVNLNASQANIGMERLVGLYGSLIEGGMFGRICDKYLDTDTYTAEEGQRVYQSIPATVTIPTTVVDTGTGLTRQPLDLAFIIVVDPVSGEPELLAVRWHARPMGLHPRFDPHGASPADPPLR